ncbi:MAG: hypothetical protein BWZ05_01294 [Bacteroidetes bacterium ADurb.BinA245]|nr:MAG: hypothetical protein BWZ05_01294 [Bacteroidetes bacterium ADurb.BinA245]
MLSPVGHTFGKLIFNTPGATVLVSVGVEVATTVPLINNSALIKRDAPADGIKR